MCDGGEHITKAEIAELGRKLAPLIGVQLQVLRLPRLILTAFEPSQIGTIIGALMDACIPELASLLQDQNVDLSRVGLSKHEGILGDREGYPDYRHDSGKRLELKLLYRGPRRCGDEDAPDTTRTFRSPHAESYGQERQSKDRCADGPSVRITSASR